MAGIPLLITDNQEFLVGEGYTVYRQKSSGARDGIVASYRPVSWVKRLLASHPFFCRFSREGIHRLYATATGGWLAIAKEGILYCPAEKKEFRLVCTAFRGSRPLYLGYDRAGETWYFGEYFSNPDREEVHVYRSITGEQWEIAYTFPAGSIRHIHNIVYDEFRRGVWVLTGDSDEESGLFFTGDAFQTLTRVFGGSQAYRAVDLMVEQDALLVPSDTPLERNYLRKIHLTNHESEVLTELRSSAFHCFRSGKWQIVTTVGEPSAVNDTNHAGVYCRVGDGSWHLRLCQRMDLWSSLSFLLFRYPEIVPVGITEDGVLHCIGIGLRGCGYGHLRVALNT